MANDIKIECEELDNFLNNADKKLQKAVEDIIENMAKNTLNAMKRNYSKAEHQAGEMMIFSKEGTETEQVVAMERTTGMV